MISWSLIYVSNYLPSLDSDSLLATAYLLIPIGTRMLFQMINIYITLWKYVVLMDIYITDKGNVLFSHSLHINI